MKQSEFEQYWRFWWWSSLFFRRIHVLKTLRRFKASPNSSRLRTDWVTHPAPLLNPRPRSTHSHSPQVRASHTSHNISSSESSVHKRSITGYAWVLSDEILSRYDSGSTKPAAKTEDLIQSVLTGQWLTVQQIQWLFITPDFEFWFSDNEIWNNLAWFVYSIILY